MSNIIQTLEAERMTRKVPDFQPGDTVVVQIKVVEGDRERVQAYEGVVIARSNRGFNSSFTVRKISHGEGVERTFQILQPQHQRDRGQAARQRAARQALLPARSRRQGRAHRGEGLSAAGAHGRRCSCLGRFLLRSVARAGCAAPVAAPAAAAGAARIVHRRACARRAPRLPEQAALVIRPSGDIVEQLSGEPLQRAINEAQGSGAPQTLLWDLTTAIRAAASDRRIGALVIETDDLDSVGQVKLEELAAAIARFPSQRQEGHCPRSATSSRASTTSPRRPMRSISTRSVSCCSTATAATACTSRMR